MQIVWFKRDLRVFDHPALAQACALIEQNGNILPLYIIEPELWQQPDMSTRHYQFLCECLHELNESLAAMGQALLVKVGRAVDVLDELAKTHTITALWSHQETWNGWTYERDKQVKRWASQHAIAWHEPRQHGIIRCLDDRNGWADAWYELMAQATLPPPERLSNANAQPLSTRRSASLIPLPTLNDLGLRDDGCYARQPGGRSRALMCLESFLQHRGQHYTKSMSSPVTAFDACSRLSPHLAFGTLSIREVFHAAQARTLSIKHELHGTKGFWRSAMRSFSGRLRWHCHFMQKLEDEPRIEYRNMHSAYDGIRLENSDDAGFNRAFFNAWATGQTGYPMVDACMRALIATGWINFRMRAMLMSFASYHLWLHWRPTALHLARLFTDYEPGIHYSQAQMQSGTTGINSIRVYNPIKQGTDQDPEGVFVRQWVPELAHMPAEYIHTPWLAPSLMGDYPLPIVDEKLARKAATDQLYAVRQHAIHHTEANAIVKKHASRKGHQTQRASSASASASANKKNHDNRTPPLQGELPL